MPVLIISNKWLQQYVDIKVTPAVLAERLSMIGVEVERVTDLSSLYQGFVVGNVLEKQNHPKADRLCVTKVNIGKETLQIVCGAPNVEVGQNVIVGLEGAVVPHDQHDPDGKPFTLKRVSLRGVESCGMICSAFEMELGDDRDGIMVLPSDLKPGTPLAVALGKNDVLYDIDITANRGDLMSHIGIARETAALLHTKLRLPSIKIKESKIAAAKAASIKIGDKKNCQRYSGRVLRGITVAPSPLWLQNVLNAVGIRPINNVVDVTNYVMLETGQPLHAFDLKMLAGHLIVVKCAKQGETFVTLDGKERELTSETLMICDGKKPVAVAGVMGGLNSEITDATTDVLIESANFLLTSIRKTSRRLGLNTAASQRFERGVDIEMTAYAANRTAQLIQEITGCEVLKGLIDVYPRKAKPLRIKIRVDRTNAIIGTNLNKSDIVAFLKRLQIQVASLDKNTLEASIPSCRYDLVEEIDLIEEVARLYGYNNIDIRTKSTITFSEAEDKEKLLTEMRNYLIGSGFNEILTLSMIDEESARAVDGAIPMPLSNPLGKEMAYMRTSLAYSALASVRNNRFKGSKDLRLFEIGNVFNQKSDQSPTSLNDIIEEEHLLLVLSGNERPPGYGAVPRKVDLFDIKGEVEALLEKFCLDKYRFIYYDTSGRIDETSFNIEINNTYAGYIAKLSKHWLEKFDIDEDVFFCELRIPVVEESWHKVKRYSQPPKFPVVTRDLAFVVDGTIAQEKVYEAILASAGEMLDRLVLFDVYTGDQIGAGKKSLAYALRFQPHDRTLTDEEIEHLVARIVTSLKERCDGVLRT
jgi:phenylalanyl-tRNA synthetase beta chain